MEKFKQQRLQDLKRLKKIIKSNDLPCNFEEYAKFYYFSNEEINHKYSQWDFSNYYKALTVLSSGDYAFNAIYHGIDYIDTFDVNRLTEYYAIGFKKRAIECLNFEQFCSLYNLKGPNLISLESEVIKNMDDVYKKFWETYKYEMRCRGKILPSVLKWAIEQNVPRGGRYNAYLDSEEAYNFLKQRLTKTKITFIQANITELPKKFGSYDLIELSNILAYNNDIFHNFVECRTKKLVNEIYEKNLNVNGIITETFLNIKKEPEIEFNRIKIKSY